MDNKKLEKLENIRNFLENDNVIALLRYVEKIKPLVSKDEDFEEIFEELVKKNYDQALLITEDILFEMKGQRRDDDDDQMEDFKDDDDFIFDGKDDDFGDLSIGGFDDGGEFYDDKDDDFF